MTNKLVTNAAETYWKNDTTSRGHLARGESFARAMHSLIEQGLSKTEARKSIAEQVQAAAPAHSKKFGAATISQYNASWALATDLIEVHGKSWYDSPDLYAVVHKAYAASMGVENIRAILSNAALDPDTMIQQIAALKRPAKDTDEDGEPKPTREYGVAHALRALVKITEHGWTQEEKKILFDACMATTVAIQPDPED